MSKKGFTIVEVLIVVAILAVIGLLGWTYYNKFFGSDTGSQESSTNTTTSSTTMPEVKSSSDLQKAADAVNAIDVDGSVDTSDISAALE